MMSSKNTTNNQDPKKNPKLQQFIRPVSEDDLNEAARNFIGARVKLLFNHPFFGQLGLRLIPEPADPKVIPTAATDGRKIYYNPHFINALTVEENVFLVAHELGHCIYEHMIRREKRDHMLWNIAGDYVINNMIDEAIVHSQSNEKYCKVIEVVQPFLDHNYDEWTTEEIYDDLLEQQQGGQCPSQNGDLIDVHIDPSGAGDGDGDGDGPGDGSGTITIGKGLSEEEQRDLENSWRDAVIQAAQTAGADNIPGGIKRMIKELLEPQMDWREIIRAQIESSLKSDYTWLRPNRKGWHMTAILPGMDNDFQIDVALAIDTSGSISQEMLTEFVSEVAGIMEQYEEYRIRIWQFDTQVYGFDEFKSDDGRDIREYEISGGGGTDFMANWTYMIDQEIEPDQFIMFTDGQPYDSWGLEDYCDTVFLIHTAYGKPEAPFGQSVYFDSELSKKRRD